MNINEVQFGFMPEYGAIDAVFILRRLQQEYHSKGRKCICVLLTWRKILKEYQGKCWNAQ